MWLALIEAHRASGSCRMTARATATCVDSFSAVSTWWRNSIARAGSGGVSARARACAHTMYPRLVGLILGEAARLADPVLPGRDEPVRLAPVTGVIARAPPCVRRAAR